MPTDDFVLRHANGTLRTYDALGRDLGPCLDAREPDAVLRSEPPMVDDVRRMNAETERDARHGRCPRCGREPVEGALSIVDPATLAAVCSALRDGAESLSRLPDVDGAYRVTVTTELRRALALLEGGA